MWATVSKNELEALSPWIIQHSHDTSVDSALKSVERASLFTVSQSRRSAPKRAFISKKKNGKR